jgi:hypothetical protein
MTIKKIISSLNFSDSSLTYDIRFDLIMYGGGLISCYRTYVNIYIHNQ